MKVWFEDAPKVTDLESCDGVFYHYDETFKTTWTFYVWCHKEIPNIFWYTCKHADIEKLSVFKIRGKQLLFRHRGCQNWQCVESISLDNNDAEAQIELLKRIRCNYETQLALLED